MSWQELGEAFLWSCLGTTITVVGSLAALIAIVICYVRGRGSTRFPLVLAFFAIRQDFVRNVFVVTSRLLCDRRFVNRHVHIDIVIAAIGRGLLRIGILCS